MQEPTETSPKNIDTGPAPHLNLPTALQTGFSRPEGIQPKTFKYHAAKPGGINAGAVYSDETGALWLLKQFPAEYAFDAVREVVASQLYRLIAGEHAAPEVQLINLGVAEQWMVASKWCHGLESFDGQPAGLEKMFVASYIIGDRDCVLKNMSCLGGKAFRFDFGAALRMEQGCKEDVDNVSSIYEIINGTGFDPLCIIQQIDQTQFLAALHELEGVHFDWNYWEGLYAEARSHCTHDTELVEESSLETQHQCVEQHIVALKQLADHSAKTDKKQPTASSMGLFSKPADQKSASLHGQKVKELTRELITFYDAISEDIRPLRHDFATVSAQKHLAYLEQHGRSPAFYTWLVERSHEAIEREAFASRLPKHLAPAQEDQLHRNFYQKIAQFSAPISARLEQEQEQEQEQATSPPCPLL